MKEIEGKNMKGNGKKKMKNEKINIKNGQKKWEEI